MMLTISRRTAGIPKLCLCQLVVSLTKFEGCSSPCVSTLPLLDVPLFLRSTHAFELEVACVCLRTELLALEDNEGDGSDNLKRFQ